METKRQPSALDVNAVMRSVLLLAKPFVTAPIVGATKPAHIDDAVAAVDLELTADEIARLEEPYRPHPVVGFR